MVFIGYAALCSGCAHGGCQGFLHRVLWRVLPAGCRRRKTSTAPIGGVATAAWHRSVATRCGCTTVMRREAAIGWCVAAEGISMAATSISTKQSRRDFGVLFPFL